MKEFPTKLVINNIDKFKEYKFNRECCKLRQNIIDYIYTFETNKKQGGFDLKNNNEGYISNKIIDINIIKRICKELEDLGWKTKMAYGNTTLFIYKNEDDIPTNINEMEIIDED